MTRAADFLRHYDRLLTKRGSFPDAWQDIADFIMPHKSDITTTRERGAERTQKVIDSTAIHARQLLAASMHGGITPPQTVWHTLKLRDKALNDRHEVQTWLEECTSRMHLARSQSNFATEIGEWYNDFAGFNTACLHVSERNFPRGDLDRRFGPRFRGFHYRAVPIREYAIDENADGAIDVLFRCFKLSARTLPDMFGASKIGEQLRDKAQRFPEEDIEIVHGVYPRDTGYEPGKPGQKNMPFAECYVAKQHRIVLREGGHEEFPYMVARWEKGSDGIWGVGPSFTALPEVRTLNRAREMVLRSAGKRIDPPLMVMNDGVVGDVDTSANGRTNVEDMNAIKPLDTGGDHQLGELVLADSRALIKDIFFWQQVQLDAKITATATEIIERVALMQRILGPTFGRFENELANPMVTREFNLMLRAGAFPPIPEALSGQDIDIQFEGPLAKAQRSQVLNAFSKYMGLILPIYQIQPDVLDNLDFDAIARETADIAGIPSSFQLSEEAVKVKRENRAAQQQADQKNAMISQMAEAAGKAAPALKVLAGGVPGQPQGQAA